MYEGHICTGRITDEDIPAQQEEKSALQLMELRAKTARIRQSLPEWVKNGLVPPRLNRKPSPPAYALVESLANHECR